jgi:carboxypeptidase family protein
MAGTEAGRNWIGPAVLAVLLAGAWAAAGAQTAGVQSSKDSTGSSKEATGSIAGRLTDLTSKPLAFATVVVRNEATGAEARTTTAKNGSYRLIGLEAGEYTIEAESPELGHGRLERIYVAGRYEARVQAAMAFEAAAPRPTKIEAHDSVPLRRVQTEVREIAVQRPEVNATLAVDAPGQLVLAGNRVMELAHEKPSTVATVAEVPLAGQTLGWMPLNGRALAGVVRAMPVTETQVLTSMVASESLQTMNLSGHAELGAAGLGADNPGASSAEQAAIALVKTPARFAQATGPVDPVTPVVETTLTAVELEALPAAGRRWQDFVLDTPTAATAAGGTSQTSLRGAGQEPAETSIDGASTRLAFGGSGSPGPESSGLESLGLDSSGMGSNGQGGRDQNGMGQAWAGGHGSPVAEAAIREVETAAGNAEVEGTRAAGGRVNVETARGSNGLHGQGFLFDRQNTWGAQNPFTQWVKETAPGTEITTPTFTAESYTPPDHEMVWGLGVGSQIRRDKLFWFGALDSYDRNDPGLATVKHPDEFFAQPSNDQMQVLSARLGLSGANPVAEGLNAYSQILTTLGGLLGPAPRRAAQWVGFGRLDWDATERNRFTVEGTGAAWNSPGGGLTRVSESYGANSFGSSEAGEALLLGRWEAFLTPNLLAVTQGSVGRTILSAHADSPSTYEQTFLGPDVNEWGQLPQINVDNRYGFTIGNPSRFGQGSYPDERVYEAQETVNWVRGSLLVKGGFELSHNFDATSLLRNQTGTYSYSSVENFASDALVFATFGPQSPSDIDVQHGCDETGTVWRDSGGNLRGRANLPCYSYYSQTMGPTDWDLSTNDWAGFTTVQWQPRKLLVIAGGLRWEREQLPPPIAALANSQLPLTEKLPSLGNNWGPRISVALGSVESHWPVLRLGYGMYFGRTENATVETALTQTGSLKGDLNLFMRPTDDCQFCAGGAPAFPSVLTGSPGSIVKPGAVEFAPNFRNPEVHQAVAAVEEELPGHVQVTASALVSLGRRLPVPIDANIDTKPADTGTITYAVENCPEKFTNVVVTCTGTGPIKVPTVTAPFYASWPSATESTGDCPTPFIGWLNPCYQAINQITSKANSTYEAAVLKVVRYGRRGLSLHAHYTYSHAMDWNPNVSPLDPNPANFGQEYGTSDLDVRHSAAAMLVFEAPWKLHSPAGKLANGWMISGIGQFRGGLPYTMRVSGSLPECVVSTGITLCAPQNQGVSVTTGDYIVGLGPGMNGSGGDNRVYGVGRNTYRYPATWKADMRVGKKFDLGQMRQLEVLVESFNLFNHQNVTELETTGYYIESGTASSPPTLNFLNTFTTQPPVAGLPPTTGFGQPLNINATNFYRERQIQAGVRMRF